VTREAGSARRPRPPGAFTPTGLAWLQAFKDAVAQAERSSAPKSATDVATVVAIGLEAYAGGGADGRRKRPGVRPCDCAP
jgi:hypothetical protein